MSFRLVQKSVTFNDFERRNGVIVRYFNEFWYLLGARRKSSRSLSHLLMSSCTKLATYSLYQVLSPILAILFGGVNPFIPRLDIRP